MTQPKAAVPITIRDIACALGLSHATVSRALADHPKTSKDTKAKMRDLAEQLGLCAETDPLGAFGEFTAR